MIRAYEPPNYLICICGFALKNVSTFYPEVNRKIGQAVYECLNGNCSQYSQPHIHHFREITLDDKAPVWDKKDT